jgi:hypothetical protein
MERLMSDSCSAYPVEVSGWDRYENFFVEKTELHWSEPIGKHILLQREVPSGTVVFLRLLDPLGVQRASPVPYRMQHLEVGRFCLVPARLARGSA